MEDNKNSGQQKNQQENEEEKKKNRKKMFILIGVAVGLVIILIVVLLLLLTYCRDKDVKVDETTAVADASETVEEETTAKTEASGTSGETTETTPEETTAEETTAETEDTVPETEETPEETTAVEDTEAPTINIYISEGPSLSAGEICYYRIKADVTGIPTPDVTWNIDDSGDSWGPYEVQVNINDPAETRTLIAEATNVAGTATDSMEISWDCNRRPEIHDITLMGDHWVNTYYTISADATDPDGDTLSYNWSVSGGSIDNEDINPMEWRTPETPGFYDITVTVDDGRGGTDSLTETVEVKELNNPPVVETITITEIKPGTVPRFILEYHDYELSAEAYDPDGDGLSYSWSTDGGEITSRNQNPANWKAPSKGYYTISVTVDDGRGGSDTKGIYVEVKEYVY